MAAKVFAVNRDGMHASQIALRYEPIESLKPDPKNARKIRRCQSYTGDSATHAATGQSFDEISSTLGEDR